MNGCPLSCPWCHNPEGRKPYREICCMADRCALCGACAHLCPCHTIDGSRHRFDSSACIGCLRCAALCPSGALAVYGSEVSAADVVAKVERDRPFYGRRGGMTLSGGEPMAQPAFALEILSLARARGLSTCVQTSGAFAPEYARALATGCDHILFDIKDTDPARHLRNTGAALEPILDNLLALDRLGARVTVKCILLAGVNDTPVHLESPALRRLLRSSEGMAVFMARVRTGQARDAGPAARRRPRLRRKPRDAEVLAARDRPCGAGLKGRQYTWSSNTVFTQHWGRLWTRRAMCWQTAWLPKSSA